MTQAGKVAEIFSTAGEAFSKLGTLAMSLQPNSERPQDVGKWGNEEIEMLRKAVTQFGNDIEKISEQIKTKSSIQIKAALKQRALENFAVPSNKKSSLSVTGSGIASQLNKSPMKMSTVARTIGQKSKVVNVMPIMGTPQAIKRAKIDIPGNLNVLTSTQPKPVIIHQNQPVGIPAVATSQAFQMILPHTKVIPSPVAVLQSGVVQRVSDANTSGAVDVES